MLWRTHFLTGAAAGLLIAGHFGHTDIKTMTISAGVAGIAALLPDIDDPHSKLGRMISPVSWVVKVAVGHRGPLHSLLATAIVFILAKIFIGPNLTLAITAGYFSHLLADSINPQGVPLFWPLRKHFGLPLVQTGSIIENIVVMPGMAGICVLLVWRNIF